MAADLTVILADIESCFDFTGLSVLHVGAGGGQFVGYAAKTRRVLGVDPDAAAVARLREALKVRGLEGRFRVHQGDVLDVRERVDVVFFEFCLHEIADPAAALRHARGLAERVLVADHAPGSAWCELMLEAGKVARSWAAVETFARELDRTFPGLQRFHDHAELAAKIGSLGTEVLERTRPFEEQRDFTISMPYRVAVLGG
jgi:SAM-dependent methyltransferase